MPALADTTQDNDLGELGQFYSSPSPSLEPVNDDPLAQFYIQDSVEAFASPDTTDDDPLSQFYVPTPVGETEKALVETPVVEPPPNKSWNERAFEALGDGRFKDALQIFGTATEQGTRRALNLPVTGALRASDVKDTMLEAVHEPLGFTGNIPLVSPDTIKKGLDALGQIGATSDEDLKSSPYAEAINQAIAENVSGLTSPNFAVTLPAYESKVVRGLAAVLSGKQAVESTQEAVTMAGEGEGPAAVKAGTTAAISAVITALLGKSALPKRGGPPEPRTPAAEANVLLREPQSLETKLPVASESPPEPGTPAAEINAVLNKEVTPDLIAAAEGKPGASAEAAATPVLRAGEMQGDLLSKQTEDLTLVGEKGPDNAAVATAKERTTQDAEMARLKAEHEQETLFEAKEYEQASGPELKDALIMIGGFPSRKSPHWDAEVAQLEQTVLNPQRKERVPPNQIFRADAPSLDEAATRLRDLGFEIEGPNQLKDIALERFRSEKPIYPKPVQVPGFGPGAASSREKLASYEQRRFGERFQKTEGINPEIREETGNRYYEPIPNKVTLADAGKIIDKRGTDESVRLVRDENFAIEPRVRATLAQSLITKLNQSHAEALAAKDAPKAQSFLDQAVDTAEYLSEFGTRLGQGVQSFAIWSRLTPDGMLESAKRTAKRSGVELTPEQMAEIRRLSAEAHAAPEGIPQQDAMKKLANYMVDKTGLPAKDLPLSIYYTHILSGVNTHLVNTVDTALNVWHEANNMAISNPRAASSIYAGLMRGIGEGKYDALMALSEGRRITAGKFVESPDLLEVSQFGKKGGVPIAKTSKIAAATKRIAESRFAKPLNAYKYVMRMMSASDSVSFRGAEEARAGLLAFRMAEARGVQERASIKKEIDSILGFDRLPEFRKQAGKEGYTGSKAEARATELMVQSRPEEIRNDAADFAGIATYNHEPRGMLGYFANAVGRASNQYPVLKLFVPFTRIVANVTNRGLDNTPIGIYRALHGGKSGLAGETKQQVLTRAIAGTAGLAGLGMLNASGVIQVHGAGPSDRERKKQLRAAGWKPFSIQVGDHYFTYTYSPVGLGTSVLGNYLDSQRYNELSQKDAQTRLAYSISRVGSTVFSQSFLSGLSNLFEILSGDPGKSISSLKRFFSSVVTGATTPNLVRDVNAIFDPVARKSDNIAQDLVRNIPVIRLGLKPTLNAFGEPVFLSRNRFFSARSEDPTWRVVVDKNLRVPVADQTTFESPDDGYEYARLSGEKMKKYVLSHISRLESATNDKAQNMLTKASRKIFDDTRSSIIYRRGAVRRARKPRR